MDHRVSAEQFCLGVWKAYMENHKYDLLHEVMDERLTVIGTGAHEISRTAEEFAASMAREETSWSGTFHMEPKWIQATPLSEVIYNVIGEMAARENADDRIIYDFDFRFTMILRHIHDDDWKIMHVHQSVADRYQSEEEFFPQKITEQSNRLLQEKIEAKTAELEEATKKIIYYSQYDSLTDVFNKHFCEEAVETNMKQYPHGIMVMLDMDSFKLVNDRYGHPFGDVVLKRLADTLKESFADSVIGRIGGDEFILYMPFSKEPDDAVIYDRATQFQARWDVYKKQLGVDDIGGVSMGVTSYPKHGCNFDTLWNCADRALYQVKNHRKGAIHFYQDS